MRMNRWSLLPALLLLSSSAVAQFSSKPITFVIPYQAGGSPLEVVVRGVAEQMSKSMDHSVIVDYKPGASTTIGATHVARSPADGHTIFVAAQSFLITEQLMSNLSYDATKDFVPISMLTAFPHALIVGPDSKLNSAQEFIEVAKAKGEDMQYGSFGTASSGHLAFEGLKKTFDFPMLHVPYKGGEGINDLIAGRLDTMLNDLPAVVPFADKDRVKILAVASKERSRFAPNIPTIEEATGTPFESQSWFGALVHANTPPEVQKKLHQEITAALQSKELINRLYELGLETKPTTPEEFNSFLNSERERLAETIAFSGARME